MASLDPSASLPGLAAALGVGLLVGLERERRKGQGHWRAAAGIRSFTLAALLGALSQWLAQALEQPALVLLGGATVGALALAAYLRSAPRDPGLTTELALVTTYLLGVLCLTLPAWGAGGGALLALLLSARGRLHHFATQVLTDNELHDGLLLAALALVAVPLMPDRPLTWLGGVEPRRLAGLVLLILLLQAVGHVALRLFGARAGLVLTGFLSGFVSSTATVASMGSRAAHGDAPREAALAGALASTAATWVQMLLILLALSPPLAGQMLPAALAGLGLAACATWLALQAQAQRGGHTPTAPTGEVLRVREAAVVALLLGVATAFVGWAGRQLGDGGVLASAALAGLVDSHAGMAALASLVGAGSLDAATARWGVLAALGSNCLVRSLVAYSAAGARFAGPVAAALGLQLAAACALTGLRP